jgi:membrane-bound lytic murein transglycosylase D
VSASELADANQLSEGQSLTGVDAVVVPAAPVMERALHAVLYTVRRGDTLISIADRFGVSLTQLRRWNHIRSGVRVAPGRRLRVGGAEVEARRGSRHRTVAASNDDPSPRRKGFQKKTKIMQEANYTLVFCI